MGIVTVGTKRQHSVWTEFFWRKSVQLTGTSIYMYIRMTPVGGAWSQRRTSEAYCTD